MIVNKSYKIKSCDDSELNLPRSSEKNPKLEFKLCWDDSEEIQALVCIIPGLGGDADDNYREHLAQFVATQYHAAVLSVNYHCIGNRSLTGVDYYLDEIDRVIWREICKSIHFKMPSSKICSEQEFITLLEALNAHILKLKAAQKLAPHFHPTLTATLAPARGEYNNFGVMSALDILNALFFVQKNPPFKIGGGGGSKSLPVIMIGSSHGGYLAHLVSKFAPWAVDGVIDNSGYAKFPWRFIGFGKEVDYMKYMSTGTTYKEIQLYCFDKTFWTSNRHSPNFFSPARRKIRYILEPSHLEIQAAYPKPIYVGYHSIRDERIAPPYEKRELYELYQKLGFDANLHLIQDESEIDGKFIKNLNHGLGMSIKALINKHLPEILSKLTTLHTSGLTSSSNSTPLFIPRSKNKSIAYPCDDLLYEFSQKKAKMCLKISKAKNACG